MRGLTIDIGNTAIKFAVVENKEITKFDREEIKDIIAQIQQKLTDEYDYIALCSVKASVLEQIKTNFPQIKIIGNKDYEQMIEMELGNPPKLQPHMELGSDIAIGCYGALKDGFKNIIVVDSGTAITVTAVIDGIIKEVYIYPGFRLSKSSLFKSTEALDGSNELKTIDGTATETQMSIDLGVYHGTNGAIKEMISVIENRYKLDFQVYLTGGDSNKLYIDAYETNDKLVNYGLSRFIEEKN